jgi:hypothetical protein
MTSIAARAMFLNRNMHQRLSGVHSAQRAAVVEAASRRRSLETRWEESFKRNGGALWAKPIWDVVYGDREPYFSTVMIGFILVAGVLVGLQTYDSLTDSLALKVIDNVSAPSHVPSVHAFEP